MSGWLEAILAFLAKILAALGVVKLSERRAEAASEAAQREIENEARREWDAIEAVPLPSSDAYDELRDAASRAGGLPGVSAAERGGSGRDAGSAERGS